MSKSQARTYQNYPEDYFQILEHFEAVKTTLNMEMEASEAHSTRRDFYRFVSAIRKAANNEIDLYAIRLSKIASTISLAVIPFKATGAEPASLCIKKKTKMLFIRGEEENLIDLTKEIEEKETVIGDDLSVFDLSGLDTLMEEREDE